MKILILGASGMLGHYFVENYADKHEVTAVVQNRVSSYPWFTGFSKCRFIDEVNVLDLKKLEGILKNAAPDVVINATGVTKQRILHADPSPAIELNALLPHRLATMCEGIGARLILFGTDCVFDGSLGNYVETDSTNAGDTYGKTKTLGEVAYKQNVLTLRKSTIGLENGRVHGLVEWYLAQNEPIKGFNQAIYSGLISAELVRLVENILINHPKLSGLYHVASEPISKFDLLSRLNVALGGETVDVQQENGFKCDRSLDATKFTEAVGYTAPSWDIMIEELAAEIRHKKRVSSRK